MVEISIVVPCYNCEKYIRKTIESLLNQKESVKEIILINDNSSDRTLDILNEFKNKYDDYIKVVEFKENRGVSYARNYGVRISKSENIIFMDSDDIADVNLVYKYSKKNFEKDYVLMYCAYYQINDADKILGGIIKGCEMSKNDATGNEFVRNKISTTGVMIKKKIFEQCGGFDLKLKYCEDWDLWIRMGKYGGFSYVDEPLVSVRRNLNNTSSNINQMLEAEKSVLEKYTLNYIEERVLNRDNDLINNTIDYVSILLKLDKLDYAEKKLKDLIKLDNSYRACFYLGVVNLKRKNFDDAFIEFNKVIKYMPDNGAALNNLAGILIIRKETENAKKLLLKALKYHQNYIDAKHNLHLIERLNFSEDNVKFTFRELRNNLTYYSN